MPERRTIDKFRLDHTINISTLISAIILISTIIGYGNSILGYLQEMTTKTNIMWNVFIDRQPQYKNLYPNR